jgi:hypothetical protein
MAGITSIPDAAYEIFIVPEYKSRIESAVPGWYNEPMFVVTRPLKIT